MSTNSSSQSPAMSGAPPAPATLNQSNLNMIEALSIADSDARPPRSEPGSESVNSLPQTPENPAQNAMRKNRLQHMLGRTRSIRNDDSLQQQQQQRSRPRLEVNRPSRERIVINNNPRTAPINPERGFRDAMSSSSEARNKSADRHAVVESDDESLPASTSRSTTSTQGPSFYSSLMQNSSRAATGIGKAGKGLFGKFSRSGSGTGERQGATTPTLENYVFQVIDLPLIDQTRKTRIKKSLKGAGDKTEFWMPSLPYRCIDYLNSHGVDSEGLYRVPGSSKEVKYWKMRFDSGPDHDIDLLAEGVELYDINVVGSMLKDWLRNLPEPLFPKSTQARIADQCAGASRTPQLMRDELSRLPPFNYYLLFALTCHISLLHSHASENKMNYNNLCICFQPCIQIDAFCFQFLVMDWRNCWQGCWTEQDYYQQEMNMVENEFPDQVSMARPQHNKQSSVLPMSSGASASREKLVSPMASHQRRQLSQQSQPSNGSSDRHARGGSEGRADTEHRSMNESPSRPPPPVPPGSPTPKDNLTPFSQDMGKNSAKRPGPPTLGPISVGTPMQM